MAAPSAPQLLILCGALRSGTTLLRVMLGQHPGITGRGESDYVFDGLTARMIDEGGSAEDRAAYAHRLATQRSPKAQKVTPPAPGPIADMMASVIEQTRPTDGLLLLTLHRHFDIAAHAFPEARFLHLVRDPRDVALSSMRMGWAGNAYHGVGVWMEAERDWQAARRILDGAKGRHAELTFESLTSEPEATLREALGGLDLDFDPAVLAPPSHSSYSAPRPNRIEGWRRELSPREAAEINWRLSDLPDDGTYDRTEKRKPSALRALQLGLESKIGRQRFAIDRYGLPLWAAEQVTRRVGKPARARVMAQVEAVNLRHLK